MHIKREEESASLKKKRIIIGNGGGITQWQRIAAEKDRAFPTEGPLAGERGGEGYEQRVPLDNEWRDDCKS